MKQVNQLMTRIYRLCTVAILALVVCSWTGIFEFGQEYTMIILIAELIIAVPACTVLHLRMPVKL